MLMHRKQRGESLLVSSVKLVTAINMVQLLFTREEPGGFFFLLLLLLFVLFCFLF